MNIKNFIKEFICKKKPNFSCNNGNNLISTEIVEITPYKIIQDDNSRLRINLLIPSLRKSDVFGGISTANTFFLNLKDELGEGADYRVIVTDASPGDDIELFDSFKNISYGQKSKEKYQLVYAYSRSSKSLHVSSNDIFIATAWWTAYTAQEIIKMQKDLYSSSYPLIYFIQDFEPCFYEWSSRYSLAESTYKSDISTIAVINSKELFDYMKIKKYHFLKTYYFVPKLNQRLKYFLPQLESVKKVNRILVYGRPSVSRNAFEIVVNSLKFFAQNENSKNWEFISLGEKHRDIDLGNGNILVSKGKVTLEEYADYLLTSKIGLSLMISPHPSYPPLEMAYFGLKTITNSYENKNLSYMHDNIVNIDDLRPSIIGNKLSELTKVDLSRLSQSLSYEISYISDDLQFSFLDKLLKDFNLNK